ncbi:hypothetical protein HMPREF3180_00376, partial [Leptotrichia wadei]
MKKNKKLHFFTCKKLLKTSKKWGFKTIYKPNTASNISKMQKSKK